MTSRIQDPTRSLCDEILAEARRQGADLVRSARQKTQALLAAASSQAEQERRATIEAAQAEGLRRRELILATLPIEAARSRAARVEAELEQIRLQARKRLLERKGFDYRAALVALLHEAIDGMAGNEFVVKLSPPDRESLGPELASQAASHPGRPSLKITISEDPGLIEGGLLVQDPDGRQVWDNRLPMRLERLWPELRRALAVQAGLVDRNEPRRETL